MVATTQGEPSTRTDKKDKPCDTCGYNGAHDSAVTCSRCGLLRHMYCMMVSVKKVIKPWVCEECLSKKDLGSPGYGAKILNPSAAIRSAPKKASLDSGIQIPHKKSDAVRIGKVKYLPTVEVPGLASNTLNTDSHLHNNPRGKFARRNYVQSRKFSPKISFLDLKENPEATSSRPVRPAQGAAPINTKLNQQEVIPGETSAFAENKNSASEDEEPILELYLENCPSLEATWKGGFKFFDTAIASGQFYGGFQAHPPCLVHSKVYEFSRKLSPVLQVKLLPQSHVWPDLFGNDYPYFDDIALYIYPSDNIERSKNNYSFLLELLETQDSVMICYVDGVELLICSSKQLHVNCQRFIERLNKGDFLWAFFRSIKTDQNVSKSEEESASLVSCKGCVINAHTSSTEVIDMDNDMEGKKEAGRIDDTHTRITQVFDMDIDMEGGKEVGRIDVVVPKELPQQEFRNNKNGDPSLAIEQIELRNSEGEVALPSRFEEKAWMNLRGKGSVTKDNWNVKEMKKENLDLPGLSEPKASEKIKENIISERTSDKSQGNLRNSKDEVGFPPGFEEKAWMNLRGKGSVTKDNWNVTKEIKKENVGLPGISDVGSGAYGVQLQRSSVDPNLTRSTKLSRGPASYSAYDSSSHFGKNQLKMGRCEDENLERMGKRGQSKTTPFPNGHVDSFNAEMPTRDRSRHHLPSFRKDQTTSRNPPPEKWVKLRTKGFPMGRTGSAGACGIITSESGKWILGYTKNLGCSNGLTTELQAIYDGLRLVWERHFRTVVVESASEEAIKCLNEIPAFLDLNRPLIECCKEYLQRNWVCRIQHSRKENLFTPWLATHSQEQPLGSLKLFEKPPPELVSALEKQPTK